MPTAPESAVIKEPFPKFDGPGDDYLDNFEGFFEHFNRAAKSVLRRVSRRHSGAYVLLLRWEDDDVGTEKEISDLEELFRAVYHYATERYLIPSDDPTTQLEYRLNDFRRASDNGTSLLIIYYGGHGVLDRSKQRPEQKYLASKKVSQDYSLFQSLGGLLTVHI